MSSLETVDTTYPEFAVEFAILLPVVTTRSIDAMLLPLFAPSGICAAAEEENDTTVTVLRLCKNNLNVELIACPF
jgi:hypothetical protein